MDYCMKMNAISICYRINGVNSCIDRIHLNSGTLEFWTSSGHENRAMQMIQRHASYSDELDR